MLKQVCDKNTATKKPCSYVEDISLKSDRLRLNYYITPSVYIPNETTALTLSYEIQNPFATSFKAFITIVDSLVKTPYNYGLLKLGPNETKRIDTTYMLTSADFNQDRLIGNVFIAKSSKRAMYGRRISNIASNSIERAPSGFKSDTGEYVLNFNLDITPNPYTLSNPTTITLRANITNTLNVAVSYPLIFVASLGVLGSTTFDLGTFNFDPLETKTVSQNYTLSAAEQFLTLIIVDGFLALPAITGSAQPASNGSAQPVPSSGELYGTRLSNLSSQSATMEPPTIAISPVFINDFSQLILGFGGGRPNYAEIGASDGPSPGELTPGYILNPVTNQVNLQVRYTLTNFALFSLPGPVTFIYWNQWPITIGKAGAGSDANTFVKNVTVLDQNGKALPVQLKVSTSTTPGYGIPAGKPYIQATTSEFLIFQFSLADSFGKQIKTLLPTTSNWNYQGVTNPESISVLPFWGLAAVASQPSPYGTTNLTATTSVLANIQLNRYTTNMVGPAGHTGTFSVFSTYEKQLIGSGTNSTNPNIASIGILGGLSHSGNYSYQFESIHAGSKVILGVPSESWSLTTWINPPATVSFVNS